MTEQLNNYRFTETHEWARPDELGVVSVGISEHAQQLLGDLVYVELPEVGAMLSQGDEAGVVESVKAASDFYAPVSGEVIAINDTLEGEPGQVNTSPYEEGWLFQIKMSDPSEFEALSDVNTYTSHLEEEA